MKKLNRSFYNRNTLLVAKELLGKVLVYKQHRGIITETEAYMGFDDPASHAYKGPTPRTKIMFGPAGFSYIYLIYGMYYCLNIVTEQKGFPAAVLIRGLKLLDDTETYNVKKTSLHLDGPGKICRHLGISKDQNEIDMINNDELYVGCIKHSLPFSQTPRIGIKVGTAKPWRFIANEA